MAKDGTARGGYQVGGGRPPKNKKTYAEAFIGITDLATPDELEAVDCPPVKDYMKAKQKDGADLKAEEVYKSTYVWLKKRGCDKLVSPQLVEQYAMSVSRWIQCENALSTYGFLAKHPTTGAAIASPYVQMGQCYMKQINATWFQIYQIVKDNGSPEAGELDPADLLMENLLRSKK